MATRLSICIAAISLCVVMISAQAPGGGPPPPPPPPPMSPPSGRPMVKRPPPCRLTDNDDVVLETSDCPDGKSCDVGPIEFDVDDAITVKAYFCTPNVLPPKSDICRIEKDGAVVREERKCPGGAPCDVGPAEYKDGDSSLSAFYCRSAGPGEHLCGVKAPDGSIAGERDCSEGLVCDMDTSIDTLANGFAVYGCRLPKPPTAVCRVEASDGTVLEEQDCRDGSPCGTEAFQFEDDGTIYTTFYCPRNSGMMPPSGGGPGEKPSGRPGSPSGGIPRRRSKDKSDRRPRGPPNRRRGRHS